MTLNFDLLELSTKLRWIEQENHVLKLQNEHLQKQLNDCRRIIAELTAELAALRGGKEERDGIPRLHPL